MLDKLLKLLAVNGISVIDISIGNNDPLDTKEIPPGYLTSITLNIPSTYDSERVLAAMLQAAVDSIHSQDQYDGPEA